MKHPGTGRPNVIGHIAGIIAILVIFQSLTENSASAALFDKGTQNSGIHNSIVQIYAVNRDPYYLSPWVMFPDMKHRGSGSVINGRRILTSAHVVANNISVEVRKSMESKKYKARVVHISHEADLAILTVDDDTFFSHSESLELGSLPEINEQVSIYGFPSGEILTITDGILSQVGHRKYIHSSTRLLAGEVLSEIHSGNSGGPVIMNRKIIGVIMQANKSGDIGHMIPAPVIQHFLSDIEDGKHDGFPDLGLVTQKTESPHRGKKGDNEKEYSGLQVGHVIAGSPAEGKILNGDRILAVNGHAVYNDGTFQFDPFGGIHYLYLVEMNQLGDKIDLTISRSGTISHVAVTLDKTKKDFVLVPGEQYDQKPRYFIYGGLVFSPLTRNFINQLKIKPEELTSELSHWPTSERKELVVALLVLPDEVNKGYHELSSRIIEEVNGRGFKDFDEFYAMVTKTVEPYVVFKDRTGSQVLIESKGAEESHERILQRYSIREDHSPDLAPNRQGEYRTSSVISNNSHVISQKKTAQHFYASCP